MHTHIIRTPTHDNFLHENRNDPITGDSIQEGDEIVFCAVCKSAFLKDTWLYLKQTHCNQHETLGKFPITTKLDIQGVTRPALYVLQCKDKITTTFEEELAFENDNNFLNLPVIADNRSFYKKNSFSIWVVNSAIVLVSFSVFLHLQVEIISLVVTFLAVMAIGIKNMFFKPKTGFSSLKNQKEIESIEIHSKYIAIKFKENQQTTKKDIRIILKSILAINLLYASSSYTFQIVKKGNKTYQFSTSLKNTNQINQLLYSLTSLEEKVSIFIKNLPYDERLKLRKWETDHENVLLY